MRRAVKAVFVVCVVLGLVYAQSQNKSNEVATLFQQFRSVF
jgi:hypothetical protein